MNTLKALMVLTIVVWSVQRIGSAVMDYVADREDV